MLHPVQGVLCVEGIQTGDGRIWTPGALTWAPLPLPLAWLADGDQHIDLTEMAPQIGVIAAIIRQGNVLVWTGLVDDEIPAGAELLRRMRTGSAGSGNRVGLSIDGDDWALEVVLTNPDEVDVFMLASGGEGERLPTRTELRTMVAAAGEGDPGGMVLFEDAVDELLWRFTRTRIRGATVCMVPAFAECYMELPPEETSLAASLAVARPEPPFPADWFTDPELDGPTPLTVTADGRVYGHVAAWESCHVGYADRCVAPPRSECEYAHAHTRPAIALDDGTSVRPGSITVGTGHASLSADPDATVAHYDDTGTCAALVRYGEDAHGIWAAGVVNPTATDDQVWALRCSPVSGDWRRRDGNLELHAVLSVNVPGFPIPDAVAASAAGECVSLIAAGARPLPARTFSWARVGDDVAAGFAKGITEAADRLRVATARASIERSRAAARR